jgi:hypothetical protein
VSGWLATMLLYTTREVYKTAADEVYHRNSIIIVVVIV